MNVRATALVLVLAALLAGCGLNVTTTTSATADVTQAAAVDTVNGSAGAAPAEMYPSL